MAQSSPRRVRPHPAPDRRLGLPAAGARTLAFLERLQGAGRYTFTRAEVQKELGLSASALKSLFWRLGRQRRVDVPHRGFYVIVTPEYRRAGSLPPSWFIDDLMTHLRRPYYVGVLSAAALHGAAHQAPHEFQVVTDQSLQIGRASCRERV